MTLNMFLRHVHPLYQAPDAPTDPEPIDPAIVADPAAEVGDVDPPEPEPIDPPADLETRGEDRGRNRLIDRISELTNRTRQAEERAAAAERKARLAEEVASRVQQGTDTPSPSARPAQDVDIDFDARVNSAADLKVWNQNANAIYQKGAKVFGGDSFRQSANAVSAIVGDEMFPAVVNAILELDSDNAHLVLREMASDVDRLADWKDMSPTRKIVELNRIAMAVTTPKTEPKAEPKAPAKLVSRAPAPPPSVDPGASKIIDYKSPEGDKLGDQEWSMRYEEDQRNRSRGRR